MYSFFRVLSLIGVLSLLSGLIIHVGGWQVGIASAILIRVGFVVIVLGFIGRLLLDGQRKVKARKQSGR
jgi:hypothetical protein